MELLKGEIDDTLAGAPPDPTPLLESVQPEFGGLGLNIATALIEAIALQIHTSPYMPQHSFDWDDTVELRDLVPG